MAEAEFRRTMSSVGQCMGCGRVMVAADLEKNFELRLLGGKM